MKKSIILALLSLLLFSTASFGQVYVGGSVRFDTTFTENGTTAIDIAPDIGYSFGRWSVGVCLTSYTNFDSQKGLSNFQFGLEPYAEYYFPVNSFLSLFIEGGAGFRWINFNLSGEYPEDTSFNFIPYFSPGIQIDLSKHWSLLAHLGRLEWNNMQKTITFSASGDSISMGLYYSF